MSDRGDDREASVAVDASADSPWAGRSRASDQSYEQRRMVVLQTAARLFWKKGYHETSFNELAELLNITKPTVYYYINSKQDCLADIAELGQNQIITALKRARRMKGTGLDRLIFLFKHYIDVLTSDVGKCLVMVSRRSLQGKLRDEIENRIVMAEEEFLALFDLAIADGSISVGNKRVVYEAVVGSLNWVAQWYNPEGKISKKELISAQVEALTKMLKP
ncbi:MAG TPA: TetR/AcrR family transcriptional regulator [Caulobacteraceae bacterium]